MKTSLLNSFLIFCFSVLAGCATTTLSPDQVREQFTDLSKLENRVAEADAADVDLLAPASFASANEFLEKGLEAAKNNNVEQANRNAREGLNAIAQANNDAKVARGLLDDVLVARAKAYDAGAENYLPNELNKQEQKLKQAGELVERNEIEEAKRARPELIGAYLALELKSVKQNTVQSAEVAVKSAKNSGAEELAPKMFAKAKEQLALATGTLDADRTQTEIANRYANQAKIYADRSAEIAETVKDFDRRKYTKEDIVIWHQNSLSTVSAPLELGLQFTMPNEKTVNTIQTAINDLKEENNKNLELAQAREDEIANIKQQQSEEMQSLRESLEEQADAAEFAKLEAENVQQNEEDKFALVQRMFDDKEANVYRVRNGIVLSVLGFDFAPGESEINSNNFALLGKIQRSIAEFGNSNVVVSGYTDSTGSTARNQKISEQRAANVAKFLTDAAGVEATKISALGFGEEKPVANNSTPEGRAQNRRIEILIKTQ